MLPSRKVVRDLLAELTGRAVSIGSTDPYAPESSETPTYALYVDQHLRTLAVVACDLELSALIGAAVATVPAGGVEDELETRRLSSRTVGALTTVLRRLGELLDPGPGRSVRMHAVYPPGVVPPNDVPVYACTLGHRLDLQVEIRGYGRGRLCVVHPTV